MFAAAIASSADSPMAVANSLLAGEPPLADSGSNYSSKIWQQHDENKTWQQQALDLEKVILLFKYFF